MNECCGETQSGCVFAHKAAFHPQFNTEEGVCVLFRVREMETWLGEGLDTTEKFQILYTEGRRGQQGCGHGGVITRSRIVAVKDSI